MTHRLVVAAIMLAALVCFATLSATARQRDVWEYSLQHTDSEGTLNKMGQMGWEAVAVYELTPSPGSVRVLMKRRK